LSKNEILSHDFVGIIFDLVRVEIRLVRLSINGIIDDTDFFLSSIVILGLVFDLDRGGFNVDADEQLEEFDLNS
jgi:hypothetical protein